MPAATRGGFRPDHRITRRTEFEAVYTRGTRHEGRFMTVFVLPTDRPVARLGIAATRRLGGAVRRNRAKRLVREVFRTSDAPSGRDIVVRPRPELLDAEFASLEADYRATLNRRRRR